MEGSSGDKFFPPPQPATFQSPYIGESSKVRSALDMLNITKILALLIGIIGFLVALWYGLMFMLWYGGPPAIIGVIYWIITGIVNLILFIRIPEYDIMIRSRRYPEAKDDMIAWGVITLIFGVLAGLLIILIVFLYLEELINMHSYGQSPTQYPQQPPSQYPPPPSS